MKLIHSIILLFICLVLQSQNVNVDKKMIIFNGANPYNLYQNIDGEKITELFDTRPDLLTQADNIYGIKIQKNDILLFVTTELNVGKLQVLSFDEKIKMTVKYTLYDFNNSVLLNQNSFILNHNLLINIDSESTAITNSIELDFKWGDVENPTIFPQNNISLLLLNKSRHVNQSNNLNNK